MKLGFIGTGNMATAFLSGIIKKGIISGDEIICSDSLESARKKAADFYGVNVTESNKEVVKTSDIVIFAVKPQVLPRVLDEIKDEIDDKRLFISIVAGKSIGWFEETVGKSFKLVRTMPNTPALVGEGMTAICPNHLVEQEDIEKVMELLSAAGKTALVNENLMDAVVAVSGSAPAYVFMMIEAMADGAVRLGMPRALAYQFASQTVLGSAKMVLETGKHPAELKDMVCSPAGTTIEAVRVLEDMGFRSSLIEAMDACAEVSKNL